jgi:hypothetical protein
VKAEISTCTFCRQRIARVIGVWLAIDAGASGICPVNPTGSQHHPEVHHGACLP